MVERARKGGQTLEMVGSVMSTPFISRTESGTLRRESNVRHPVKPAGEDTTPQHITPRQAKSLMIHVFV